MVVQLQACGSFVARRGVFSGPQKEPFRKNLKLNLKFAEKFVRLY